MIFPPNKKAASFVLAALVTLSMTLSAGPAGPQASLVAIIIIIRANGNSYTRRSWPKQIQHEIEEAFEHIGYPAEEISLQCIVIPFANGVKENVFSLSPAVERSKHITQRAHQRCTRPSGAAS